MKGTLQGKLAHIKKWKGRWLIIRYNRQSAPEVRCNKFRDVPTIRGYLPLILTVDLV